jgi:acetylornithine/succinyldiaminopimelate/putrescine aminotransferase
MPYKDPKVKKAKHKEYSAKYYQKNKEAIKAGSKITNAAARRAWVEYKATLACTVCGFSHPAVIDFHHPPGTKKYGVNDLVANRRFTKAYKEVKKCIVMCSNCHRIHHYNEKGAEAPI